MIRKIVLTASLFGVIHASAQHKIDLEAHRGGRGLMPENTIAAMKSALDMGVTTMEMDLGISKDGQVVVSHDSYMAADFMLKPDGSLIKKEEEKSLLLYGMDYQLIKSYDAGTKPHPQFPDQKKFKTYRPLFRELIDSVESYIKAKHLKPVYYNVEIKSSPDGDGTAHPVPEVFVKKVMDIVLQKKLSTRLIIQSFDLRPLQVLHKGYPKQKVSFLVANKDSYADNIKKLGFTPDAFSPYYLMVNREMVDAAHRDKVIVLPWTVNTIDEIRKMEALGVDGIISDYPNLLIEVFGKSQ
ncbi:glycerophosphodiester phosphodiesterase family protein [Pedobacter sp. MR2016-24]|uniref:glycerophosphodiester phosphodiesterase family protein n=1 Tax=Pedobacter sp. MR2016-24 TaxID=2994466 RepID=UPI002246872E|nr:glycerophosphodiester phosphodiesterase family protein [Pedobacter sp. MR2016-24]MCX2483444.1 glycerophosphodiester phosphodiesterase family protein [Pedobacter sp. MR2016-24]